MGFWGPFLCFTESREPCGLNLLALSYALCYNPSNVITPAIQLCSLTRRWSWRDGSPFGIGEVLYTSSSNKLSTAFFASTFRFYQLLHAVRYPVWLPEATREFAGDWKAASKIQINQKKVKEKNGWMSRWKRAYSEWSNDSVVKRSARDRC